MGRTLSTYESITEYINFSWKSSTEKNAFAAFGRTPSTYEKINGRQKFCFESFEGKERLCSIWKPLSFNHRWCCNHSLKSVTKI